MDKATTPKRNGFNVNPKDFISGLIFVAIGAGFGYGSLDYNLGTAFRMGPGYFPLLLSGVLVFLGVVIMVGSLFTQSGPIGTVSTQGLVFVLLAPITFGLTVRGLGLVPSIALVALFGALASRRTTVLTAIISTAALTALCVAIFSYGLGVPLRLFGPWLDPLLGAS